MSYGLTPERGLELAGHGFGVDSPFLFYSRFHFTVVWGGVNGGKVFKFELDCCRRKRCLWVNALLLIILLNLFDPPMPP